MKQLLLIIFVLGIALFAFFQYKDYKKFNPPSDYTYKLSEQIDVHYHDPITVQTYFENAYKIESLARELWYNEGIDVLSPDNEVPDTRNAVAYYNQMKATTKKLEALLTNSAELKKQGFNNDQILAVESEGMSPNFIRLKDHVGILGTEYGNEGNEVWQLQGILRKKGYEMPHDGVFQEETEQGLKDFQTKNGLFPSGKVDYNTLKALTK